MSRSLHSIVVLVLTVSLPPATVFADDLPPEDVYDPAQDSTQQGISRSYLFSRRRPPPTTCRSNYCWLSQDRQLVEDRGAEPTIENGYGIMALRDSEFSDSLKLASKLLKLDVGDSEDRCRVQHHGAAAVLDRWARKAKIDRSQGLDAWLPIVIQFAGLDAESSKFFAHGVYQKLQMGFSKANAAGEVFEIAPQPVGVDLTSLIPKGLVAVEPTVPPTSLWFHRQTAETRTTPRQHGTRPQAATTPPHQPTRTRS